MSTSIRYLEHPEIDKARWDKSITACPHGMAYAKSWYLDIVSPDWDALVDDNYGLLMPLPWRKKYGVKYICQPPFTQQLGLFSSSAKATPAQVKNFLQAIPGTFRYIDQFLHHTNELSQGAIPGIKIKPRLTHHRSLEKDYEKIRKDYSENLIRNLRKADALIVVRDIEIDELISLFRKNRGEGIETLGSKEYAILRQLAATALKKKEAALYGIRSKGKLIAGALFVESDHEYIFLFSATGEEAKKTGAMSLIIDRFILDHAGDRKVLDFEGSMDKNLSRFYKSFGADEIVYLHIQENRLPGVLRWMKR